MLCLSPAAQAQLNMTQLSNLDSYVEYNEVWGYTNGVVELAILGTTTGTSFIDATNPASPSEVAFIPGPESIWRDMKTYQNYCYIVNETGGGVQIVDLSDPLTPTLVGADSTYFTTGHNAFVDTAAAMLYVCGTNQPGTVIFDISTPDTLNYVTTYADPYVHDLFVRNGVAYLADIYNGNLRLIDVSALPTITGCDFATTAGFFTHNTWLTDDSQYCLTTDENSGGHVQVWDVSDPYDIFAVAEWEHQDEPASIVHNVLCHGDYAYASWYRTGVQVLDITDPRFPQRVGYFDSSVFSGDGFNGNWGVYPYQPSGTIYISDIENGFYALSFNPVYGYLTGNVDDSVSALPLEEVACSIASENNTVHTLANGDYQFALTGGSYEVIYSKFAYESDTTMVMVTDNATTVQDISLVRLPEGSLSGFVNPYGSYDPIQFAQVVVNDSPLSATTDANGEFTVPQIPAGDWTVTVDVFGYAPATVNVSIVEGQNTEVSIYLIPAVYADDLESASGWTTGIVGDTASRGIWELADPEATGGGNVQPELDHTLLGNLCFVTDGRAGTSIGSWDVDGGKTTLLSPMMDLTGLISPQLRYYRWYTNNAGANPNTDFWLVEITDDAWATWTALENTPVTDNSWTAYDFNLLDFIDLTDEVQIRFVASDLGGGSIVEALVDDIAIYATGVVGVGDEAPQVTLLPAARNPFQQQTALRFTLDRKQHVRVDVFDIGGRRVRNLVDAELGEGLHALPWSGQNQRGQDLAAGVYFARFQVGEVILKQKVVKVP